MSMVLDLECDERLDDEWDESGAVGASAIPTAHSSLDAAEPAAASAAAVAAAAAAERAARDPPRAIRTPAESGAPAPHDR